MKGGRWIAFGCIILAGLAVSLLIHVAREAKPTESETNGAAEIDPVDLVGQFCEKLANAGSYRVTIIARNIVGKNGFESECTYDLAIARPNKARLWSISGGSGPMLLTNGTTLWFWMLPHRNPNKVVTAPKSLNGINSESLLGKRAISFLANYPPCAFELIVGEPLAIRTRYLPDPRLKGIESVNGADCYAIESVSAAGRMTAWFEKGALPTLRRLQLQGTSEEVQITHQQDFENWQFGPEFADDFFDLPANN